MNNTETNYISHINQEKNKTPLADVIDVIDDANAYVDIIKENINYSGYMRSQNLEIREMYDELFQVICEVVCVKRRTVNVGGQEYPYELVRSRFLKLNNSHLEYMVCPECGARLVVCVKKGKVSVFDDTRSEEELAKKRHARLTRYAAKINEIVK